MSIKLTILFENPFWVGVFENDCENRYSTARFVFGAEPKDEDVYRLVMSSFQNIAFSAPSIKTKNKKGKINPKRMIRMIRREVEGGVRLSKAYSAIRQQREMNKKVGKTISRRENEEETRKRYDLRQAKKKEKKKGH